MSGQRRHYLLNSFIPVFAGVIIYTLFRKDAYISLLLDRFVSFPEIQTSGVPAWVSRFVKNYAADVLWAYSLTFAVMWSVNSENSLNDSLEVFSICFCFICLVELFQKTGVFRGTYDFLDISFETVSVCFAIFIAGKGGKRK